MILQSSNIKKYFKNADNVTKAIDGVSISINQGEFVAVMGESGSGKTTLLKCLATIDKPDSGDICLGGVNITDLKDKQLPAFRSKNIGFVFQEYNLLDALTVKENLALPLSINGYTVKDIKRIITEFSCAFRIETILNNYPCEISGGQQQRCACARALIHRPEIIFADEPTGALDSKSSKMLLELFELMNSRWNTTILMVTHNITAASYAQRIMFLSDGLIKTEITYNDQGKEEYRELIYRNVMN